MTADRTGVGGSLPVTTCYSVILLSLFVASGKADDSGYWVGWMEKCDKSTALVKGDLKSMKDDMGSYEKRGYHLQALGCDDYGMYIGFFVKGGGDARWTVTTSLGNYEDEVRDALRDGFSASTLAYCHCDGVYLGWFRETDVRDSIAFLGDTDGLWAKMNERLEGQYWMSAVANGADFTWIAWFRKFEGRSSRIYRKSGRAELHDALDDVVDRDYAVVAVASSCREWIVWAEEQENHASRWATRSSTSDMYDWISGNRKDDFCLTSLKYGCV